MGYEGVETALAASRNERVPTHVDTDASLITKANMNSPRSSLQCHRTLVDPTPGSRRTGEPGHHLFAATRLITRRSSPPERSIVQATLGALREGDVHAV
jgi:hypothetical protein